MSRSRRQQASFDLDEIAPNRFVVHNLHVNAVLKGEGTTTGRIFELTTWRRDGLLARLRGRGFRVRTLSEQLAELPTPPPPPPINRPIWRPLVSAIEQISHFDLRNLRWHPLTPTTRDGMPGVTIYDGWVLRRRKGRGAAAYYLAFAERTGGIGLRPLDETIAILTGYAQAMALDDRPLVAERRGEGFLLPDIELPPPYRTLLESIAEQTEEGKLAHERDWPLVQELFQRLGVQLVEARE